MTSQLPERGADFGEIKINLNWNRGAAPAPAARGFLAGLFNKGQGDVDASMPQAMVSGADTEPTLPRMGRVSKFLAGSSCKAAKSRAAWARPT